MKKWIARILPELEPGFLKKPVFWDPDSSEWALRFKIGEGFSKKTGFSAIAFNERIAIDERI